VCTFRIITVSQVLFSGSAALILNPSMHVSRLLAQHRGTTMMTAQGPVVVRYSAALCRTPPDQEQAVADAHLQTHIRRQRCKKQCMRRRDSIPAKILCLANDLYKLASPGCKCPRDRNRRSPLPVARCPCLPWVCPGPLGLPRGQMCMQPSARCPRPPRPGCFTCFPMSQLPSHVTLWKDGVLVLGSRTDMGSQTDP
jgi:hypothetical protein